jgi:hypothetical protein
MSTVQKFNDQCLTIERLKAIEGFEYLTDQEAQDICDFTNTYASILVDSYMERKQAKDEKHNGQISKIRKK